MAREGAFWFSQLFGFKEPRSYAEAQQRLLELTSGPAEDALLAGKRVGEWHFESLSCLRTEALQCAEASGLMGLPLMLANVNGDVRALHADPANEGAMFQAASQLNCLEMRHSGCTPEDGVTCYWQDSTQGPACALACGAACAFRNYLVPVGKGQVGQTAQHQLDSTQDLRQLLSPDGGEPLWWAKNGYAESSATLLEHANEKLAAMADDELSKARDSIRIGVHFDCEVTRAGHLVAQAFCGAIPVGRSAVKDTKLWQPLAELVLEAVYEATLWSHVLYTARFRAAKALPPRPLYLTQVGGGVFGNEDSWICNAIGRACSAVRDHSIGLDIRVVHFGGGTPLPYSMLERRCRQVAARRAAGESSSDAAVRVSTEHGPRSIERA
mmetsp:Transcript_70186/g.217056  ORF Transcript_70186/g.217056 Transcript_70186/m.217056 type:complete len:383 (+) Transcript_70186:51-1199(+)